MTMTRQQMYGREFKILEGDGLTGLCEGAIAAGESFARICGCLDTPRRDGALRAASLLKRWLADGLLAAI